MNKNCHSAALAVEAAIRNAESVDELGHGVVTALDSHIPFERFNIGRINQSTNLFSDEFVFGQNVAGRPGGHQRTLIGSVVEAAIEAGPGFYFGNPDQERWLERFPRFGPVFESGIRAMLAVPLRDDNDVVASLVFASRDPQAYGQQNLQVAVAASDVIHSSRVFLALFCEKHADQRPAR